MDDYSNILNRIVTGLEALPACYWYPDFCKLEKACELLDVMVLSDNCNELPDIEYIRLIVSTTCLDLRAILQYRLSEKQYRYCKEQLWALTIWADCEFACYCFRMEHNKGKNKRRKEHD